MGSRSDDEASPSLFERSGKDHRQLEDLPFDTADAEGLSVSFTAGILTIAFEASVRDGWSMRSTMCSGFVGASSWSRTSPMTVPTRSRSPRG